MATVISFCYKFILILFDENKIIQHLNTIYNVFNNNTIKSINYVQLLICFNFKYLLTNYILLFLLSF